MDFEKGDIERIYEVEFAELKSGHIKVSNESQIFEPSDGEKYLAAQFKHVVGKHQKEMQSPILYHRIVKVSV